MCPVNVVCGLKLDFCEVEYAMFMISIQFHVGDFFASFFWVILFSEHIWCVGKTETRAI